MSHTLDPLSHAAEGRPDCAAEAEALLTGTLALMTAYAKSCCDGCRELIAGKIIFHLAEVSQHPAAAAGLRTMAMNLHGCWIDQLQTLRAQAGQEDAADAGPSELLPPRTLWHATPETVQ